jgi:hypothetical protein
MNKRICVHYYQKSGGKQKQRIIQKTPTVSDLVLCARIWNCGHGYTERNERCRVRSGRSIVEAWPRRHQHQGARAGELEGARCLPPVALVDEADARLFLGAAAAHLDDRCAPPKASATRARGRGRACRWARGRVGGCWSSAGGRSAWEWLGGRGDAVVAEHGEERRKRWGRRRCRDGRVFNAH